MALADQPIKPALATRSRVVGVLRGLQLHAEIGGEGWSPSPEGFPGSRPQGWAVASESVPVDRERELPVPITVVKPVRPWGMTYDIQEWKIPKILIGS